MSNNKDTNFINLHVHTEYSTLDGIIPVKKLPEIIRDEHKESACAVTEHGVCTGHYQFYKHCRSAGIKPILGMEAYVSLLPRQTKERDHLDRAYYHLILLAMNDIGLRNLNKISTESWTTGFYTKNRADLDLLSQYSEGLIVSTACLGSLFSQLILRSDYKELERMLDYHADVFKDRFFLELQTHTGTEQRMVNDVLMTYSKSKNLPLIVTSDAHYTHKSDKELHELSLRMATEGQGDGFSFGDIDCHLHTHDEIWEACKLIGIPYEAISNTVHVASMIDDKTYYSDKTNHYPKFKNLPNGLLAWEYLEALGRAGLIRKIGYPIPEEYELRFKEEITLFKRADMSDYLLIIWELLSAARDLDALPGFGRGSAGGSLICYSLDITHLDPIKYKLLLSRFLNDGRLGTPLIFKN